MRKFIAVCFCLQILLQPISVFAATSLDTPQLLSPGSQINASRPSSLPVSQPQSTSTSSTQGLLSEQLTYVRSNMDAQAQWFANTSAYLLQVADYVVKMTPEKTDVAQLISAYATALQKVADDMKSRQQVIPLEYAIALSGFGLHLLAESLVAAASALQDSQQGTSDFFFPSMALVGESLQKVGDNIISIGLVALNSNGNINVAEYQSQMEAGIFLYRALQGLFTSRDGTGKIKADLQSNQAAKATNSTYQVIQFDASNSTDSLGTIQAQNYFWDFGDGTFAFGPFVSHTYTKAATYLVKIMVRGQSGFSAVTSEVKVVPVNPVAVIVTDKDSLLGPIPDQIFLTANEAITLSGLSSYDPEPGKKLKLTWDFGDGKQDSGVDNGVVTHAYAVPGDYDLVLRAEDGQFSNVAKRKIRVISAPPDIKLQVRSATQSTWSNAAKRFFVQNVFGPTALDFTAQESSGALVQGFNARTRLVQADWDFGDGATVVTQNQNQLAAKEKVSHSYEKSGIYTVTLKITDEAQNVGQVTKTIILNDSNIPSADFDLFADNVLTTASQVRFDASSASTPQGSIIKYDWRIVSAANELVSTSSSKNFVYSFPKPGKYEVSLQVTTNLGAVSSRVSDQLIVASSAPLAVFDFSFDPYIPNKIVFDASASSDPDKNDTLTYSWDFNSDGNIDVSNVRAPQFTQVLDSVGINRVTLQVTDSAGLFSTVTKDITIASLLVSTMQIKEGTKAIGNAPLTVHLLGGGFRSLATRPDTNAITEFTWDFGDGTATETSTQIERGVQEKAHTYTHPGRYIATLKVKSAEGEESISAYPIHVGDGIDPIASIFYSPSYPLTATIASNFTFDGSQSVNVRGDTSNLDYAWDFGDDTALGSSARVNHQYTRVGTYNVTLTVTDTVASKISRVQVQVMIGAIPDTVRLVASPVVGSAPLTVQLDASSSHAGSGDIIEYRFDFGDGDTLVSSQPKTAHIYKNAGIYKVKVTIRTANGVSTSSDQAVTVN